MSQQAQVLAGRGIAGRTGPGGKVTLFRNSDFGDVANFWETNVASAGKVVLYTGNWGAAYSDDGGKTFNVLNPYALMAQPPAIAGGFCCDQVVTYVPKFNLFVWVLQSATCTDPKTCTPLINENEYRIAVATPAQIVASKGKSWRYWDMTSKSLTGKNTWYDYEEVSFGDNYLYLSYNVVGGGKMALARLSLADMAAGGSVAGSQAFARGWWIRSVQNGGSKAFFATLTTDSQLRLFSWDESAGAPTSTDVSIPTVATQNWSSKLPDGTEWLLGSKLNWNVQGATRAGDELWLAWSAGRDVVVGKGKVKTAWAQPHIEIAVVNATTLKLIRMEYIWSSQEAFAWPSLATNADGDVGLIVNYGGGKIYSFPVVGILTGGPDLLATISGPTVPRASGGHYNGVRPHYPNGTCFSAAGFDQFPLGKVNRPHYYLFGRSGAECDPPPAKAPVVVTGPATGVGTDTATITGTVDPNGSTTNWFFQWGTTSAYGNKTPLRNAGSGTAAAAVSELLTGLSPGTTYHYVIVGDNEAGTAFGSDQTFTTKTVTPPPPGKLPDLIISDLTKDSFTVANQGEAAAGPFTVSLTNSNTGTATYSFPGLAPGASSSQSFFCYAGQLTAVADSGGTVAESNKSNNTATLTVASCIS